MAEIPARKIKILIVNGSETSGVQMRDSLNSLGYDVCGCANSGKEALKKAEDCWPDIILMDITLQGPMDGIETAKVIKDSLNIPILYLTENTGLTAIIRARETYPYGFIPKTADALHLVSTIDAALCRRELELRLSESEEKFRAISENIMEGVAFTIDAKCYWANDSLAEIFGYTKEEMIGHGPELAVHPDEMPWFMHRIEERLKGSGSDNYRLRALRKDGSEIIVEIKDRLINFNQKAAILLTVRDVTENVRAEEALRGSEERFRSIANNLPGLVFQFTVCDNSKPIVNYVGERCKEVFGLERMPLESFFERGTANIHPDDLERWVKSYTDAIRNQDKWDFEGRYVNPSGHEIWLKIISQPTLKDGKLVYIGIALDITDRKLAEQYRIKLDAQLQQTQKLESLGILAGGIAHDFNNLLMTILGNIDLALLEFAIPSSARLNLHEAIKASHRAAELCKQMLAYSGRGKFIIEALNLNTIIQNMARMLEISVSKKSLLQFNLTSEIPDIEADGMQIRQVLMNLTINSSEAIGNNNGVIAISTGAMWCGPNYFPETWLNENLHEGMYSYIEVTDTGCGIDQEDLPKIFDPFFTTKFTGRGLGLAAVLGIVKGHRGAIKVQSDKGKGATFKIFFPAISRTSESARNEQNIARNWRGAGVVLLVDDEPSIRVLGKQMLERLGFTVLTAENGRHAVDVFKENAAKIRCVILDLTMPQMDGEEAFIELRRIRNDACVIMSSGYDEQEITERLMGKGLNGFIHKPYRSESLAAQLKKVLG